MNSSRYLSDTPKDIRVARQHGLQLSSMRQQIGKRIDFEAPVRLSLATTIGNCAIGAFTYVGINSEIRNTTIGRFCSIASNASFGPAEHPTNWLSSHPFQFNGVRYFDEHPEWNNFSSRDKPFTGNGAATHIGNDVWVGRNAIVKQGVHVEDGAVIAAGSFVNRDIPPYAIVAGAPARLIRYRFSQEIIKRLLILRWWDWKLDPSIYHFDFSDVPATIEKLELLRESDALIPFIPAARRLEKTADGFLLSDLTGTAMEKS